MHNLRTKRMNSYLSSRLKGKLLAILFRGLVAGLQYCSTFYFIICGLRMYLFDSISLARESEAVLYLINASFLFFPFIFNDVVLRKLLLGHNLGCCRYSTEVVDGATVLIGYQGM